ncbi:hypothetical protein GCM10009780_68110 [Actinomadura alba]
MLGVPEVWNQSSSGQSMSVGMGGQPMLRVRVRRDRAGRVRRRREHDEPVIADLRDPGVAAAKQAGRRRVRRV